MDCCEWRSGLISLANAERHALTTLLKRLGALEEEDLAVRDGYPSLYAYLTGSLGWSESAALKRIRAARACREFPALLRLVRVGRLSLETLAAIAPHLCRENWKTLVKMTAGMPSEAVRRLTASLDPKAEPRPAIRAMGPKHYSPSRFEVLFGASEDFLRSLGEAKSLLRHRYPSGRIEDVLSEAVERLVDGLESKSPGRIGKKPRLRVGSEKPLRSRYIPRRVRAEVWKRDAGRCSYLAPDGRRCEAVDRLEFDHVVPWAFGGVSDDPGNIRLLCRSHNQWRVGREDPSLLPSA